MANNINITMKENKQMTPSEFCIKHNACAEGGAFAVQFPTLAAAWDACERVDWLFWAFRRTHCFNAHLIFRFVLRIARETPLHGGRTLYGEMSETIRAFFDVADSCLEMIPANETGKMLPEPIMQNLVRAIKAAAGKKYSDVASYTLSLLNEGFFCHGRLGVLFYDLIFEIKTVVESDAKSEAIADAYMLGDDVSGEEEAILALDAADLFFAKVFKELVPNPFIKTEGGAS
jgi:hypothetical protein